MRFLSPPFSLNVVHQHRGMREGVVQFEGSFIIEDEF